MDVIFFINNRFKSFPNMLHIFFCFQSNIHISYCNNLRYFWLLFHAKIISHISLFHSNQDYSFATNQNKNTSLFLSSLTLVLPFMILFEASIKIVLLSIIFILFSIKIIYKFLNFMNILNIKRNHQNSHF